MDETDQDRRTKDLLKEGLLDERIVLGARTIDRLQLRRWWRPCGNSARFWKKNGEQDPFERPEKEAPLEKKLVYVAGRFVRLDKWDERQEAKKAGFGAASATSAPTGTAADRWGGDGLSSEDLTKQLKQWEKEIPVAKSSMPRTPRGSGRPQSGPGSNPDAPMERHVPPVRPQGRSSSSSRPGRMRMSARGPRGTSKPAMHQANPVFNEPEAPPAPAAPTGNAEKLDRRPPRRKPQVAARSDADGIDRRPPRPDGQPHEPLPPARSQAPPPKPAPQKAAPSAPPPPKATPVPRPGPKPAAPSDGSGPAVPTSNAAVPKARPPAPEPPPAAEATKPKPMPPVNRSLKTGGMDDLFGAPTESRVRMSRTKKAKPSDGEKKKD